MSKRVAATLGISCLALLPWSTSATADSEGPLEEYLESPHVAASETGEITLNLLEGGEAAFDDTVEAMPALEGRTITVVVPDPLPLAERIARDAQLEADEPHNRNDKAACPSMFESPRSSRGARPDLGCDESTGKRQSGPVVPGPLRESVGSAIEQALILQAVDGAVPRFEVSERAGRVVVNFGDGWSDFLSGQESNAGLVQELLIRTVRSDQRAKSVMMSLNGSCIDFALSIGGDMCGETRF